MLEYDNTGLECTIKDHDVTVRLTVGPESEGKRRHLEIGVAMYGPFIFPEKARPISPILWLCLLEEDASLREIQIILPHFLSGLTRNQLGEHQVQFAKADHSIICATKNGVIQYKFTSCETQPFFVSSGCKSYGILVSNHCCFYCITAKHSPDMAKDAGYCLARISNVSLPSEIYFVASFFLETCIRVC